MKFCHLLMILLAAGFIARCGTDESEKVYVNDKEEQDRDPQKETGSQADEAPSPEANPTDRPDAPAQSRGEGLSDEPAEEDKVTSPDEPSGTEIFRVTNDWQRPEWELRSSDHWIIYVKRIRRSHIEVRVQKNLSTIVHETIIAPLNRSIIRSRNKQDWLAYRSFQKDWLSRSTEEFRFYLNVKTGECRAHWEGLYTFSFDDVKSFSGACL